MDAQTILNTLFDAICDKRFIAAEDRNCWPWDKGEAEEWLREIADGKATFNVTMGANGKYSPVLV